MVREMADPQGSRLQNMDLIRTTKQGRTLTGPGIRRCQELWPNK